MNIPSRASRGESVRLTLGIGAVCTFASVGLLHLYGVVPETWHVAVSVLATLLVAVVLAWETD